MKQTTKITLLTAALLAAFPLQAMTDRTADVQFKAAEHKEQVEGDLKGAIEQYKKIAQSKDRSIAVQALIRMAECYQKLGDAESRKIYERVVTDFADQKEAVAIARARLDGPSQSGGGKSDRTIWSGQSVVAERIWSADFVNLEGSISQDGNYYLFYDTRDKSNLAIRDLRTGRTRALTRDAQPDANTFPRFPRL